MVVLFACGTAAGEKWQWQEAEYYRAQQGAARPDGKRAAGSFGCLGMGWGWRTDHFAEYEITLAEAIPAAVMHLRYARGGTGRIKLDLLIDGRHIGNTPTLELSRTPGWGDKPQDWRFVSLPLGALEKGQHLIRLAPAAGGSNLNIDGFYIAPADCPPAGLHDPQTHQRDALRVNPGIIGQIARRQPTFAEVQLSSIDKKTPATASASPSMVLDEAAQVVSPLLRAALADKPTCFLVNAYDVGAPTDADTDVPWHLLDKEKDDRFENPYLGKLGLFNPNADITWLMGVGIDDGAIDYAPPGQYTDHLINLAARRLDLGPVEAEVLYLPATSSTVLAVVHFVNQDDRAHAIHLESLIARQAVELAPRDFYDYGIHVTAGKLQKIRYDKTNGAVISQYDDWDRDGMRPIGTLQCALTADQSPTSYRYNLNAENEKPANHAALLYDLNLPPRGSDTICLSLNLLRYGDASFTTKRGYALYKDINEDAALQAGLRAAADALAVDWPEYVQESYHRYERMPLVTLPRERWSRDFYCCLELPRACTWSPQDKIDQPWYTFCRPHGHDPYGWWSYGMHAHEHLSTFTVNLFDPQLSQAYIRGHFQVQREDGSIQYGVNRLLKNIHGKLNTAPFLMWEAWRAYGWSGDREFLADAYAVGKPYLAWWSSPARTREGAVLQHWLDFVESVRDDADLATWTATDVAERQEALDLNCYLLNEEKAMAAMARELGLPAEAGYWAKQADTRRERMRRLLWHEEDRLYYGRDTLGDRWARVQDISTFFPLWCGLSRPGEYDDILKPLGDPGGFATDWPVATLAVQHMPDEQRGEFHWKGANWVEMSMLPVQGLRRYGGFEAAADLAVVNSKMVFDSLERHGHFYEYYNSITGERAGLTDYIWTSLPAAMLIETVFGIRPTQAGLEILPALPQGWDRVAIENLHVRDSVIALRVEREASLAGPQVTVEGRAMPLYCGRGVLIPWSELPQACTIDIVHPATMPDRSDDFKPLDY